MSDEHIQANEQAEQSQSSEQTGGQEPAGGESARTFTQEEVERILAARLKRKEREVEERIRQEREREEMSELERLKAELADWKAKAQAVQREALVRQAHALAVEALADAGVPAARRAYALRMMDLSAAIGDDGLDEAAVRRAVKSLLNDIPELAGGGQSRAGGDFSGGARSELTEEAIASMSSEELKRRWPEIQAYYGRRQ